MTDAPAKPKPDAFDAFESDLRHPRTLRIDGGSFVFMPRPDGSVDLVIYHGGQTLAAGFSPKQVAVMAAALAPRAAPPGRVIAPTPATPAPAPSGGIRPDGKTAHAAAAPANESKPRAPGWPRETGPATAGPGGGARQPAKAGSAAGGKS